MLLLHPRSIRHPAQGNQSHGTIKLRLRLWAFRLWLNTMSVGAVRIAPRAESLKPMLHTSAFFNPLLCLYN
jgi:hypothetical protein